jgi:CheY-like chemotaxis protein
MPHTKPLIAVVNDDTAFLELMEELLREEGYQTLIWKEGDTAYELIKKKQPDLVILDIRMEQPDSGWVVLELLRLDPATEHVPVIVCSAAVPLLREREQQLKAHHCEILEKPFNLSELLSLVSTIIGPPSR